MSLMRIVVVPVAAAAIALAVASCPAPTAANTAMESSPQIAVRGPQGAPIANGGTYSLQPTQIGDWREVTLTIANLGSKTLELTESPAVLVGGPDAGLFSVTTEPETSLAPGAWTTFSLRFAPDAADLADAEVSIASSDPGASPYSFTVLASGITQDLQSKSESSPSVAWTGSEYGLAWQDERDGNWEIYFARFDADGRKVGSDVRVTAAANSSLNPSLAWTGTEYGVAWHDGRDGNWEIYFARLDADGNKIGGDVRVTDAANSSQNASLAWTGTEYGVAWHDGRDGNWEIYFARLDADGNKIGGDLRVTDAAESSQSPSLAWGGTDYCVAWYDGRDDNWEIYSARISSAGAKVGSDVRVTDMVHSSQSPSLVRTASGYGTAWYDGRDGNWEIYFAALDTGGAKAGNDVRVTTAAGSSQNPSLAWNGTGYGVAWYDDRAQSGTFDVFFIVRAP